MLLGRLVFTGKISTWALCSSNLLILVRFMGAMTNNGRKLANFAGFYKGIQSVGSAVTWRLDDLKIPYMTMFASNWGLLAGSLLVALPVILWKVEDTTPLEKDLEFTDETAAEVLPHSHTESVHPEPAKV